LLCFLILIWNYWSKKYRYQAVKTKASIKTQKTKYKTITWNKETQTTGQHEPLWKPEAKSGAPEGQATPAPHAAPATMPPMSYQGMKRTLDKKSWPAYVTSHGGHWDTIRERQMIATTKNLFKYWSQSTFYEAYFYIYLDYLNKKIPICLNAYLVWIWKRSLMLHAGKSINESCSRISLESLSFDN